MLWSGGALWEGGYQIGGFFRCLAPAMCWRRICSYPDVLPGAPTQPDEQGEIFWGAVEYVLGIAEPIGSVLVANRMA